MRVLIICGGRRTEKDYFNGLRDTVRNPAVSIRVKGLGVDPLDLVKSATKERAASPDEYDQIWVVFDVDQFDIKAALDLAAKQNIRTAVSNPCFELWLLLHFQAHTAYIADYKAAVQLLTQHVPEYNKSRIRFADYSDRREEASRNARSLMSRNSVNPLTEVVLVCDVIRGKPTASPDSEDRYGFC